MTYNEKAIAAAKIIVEEFENDIPSLYEPNQFERESECVALYLAAKNFLRLFV